MLIALFYVFVLYYFVGVALQVLLTLSLLLALVQYSFVMEAFLVAMVIAVMLVVIFRFEYL